MASIDQTPPRARGGPQPSFQPGETPCEVATSERRRKLMAMPLEGECAPSPWDGSREQAEKYAESGGSDAADMKGMPIILLTTVGAKTGKLRKTPLMCVEHDGDYAVVASLGGARKNPVWYYTIDNNPRGELRDGPVTRDYDAREVCGDEKPVGWDRAGEAY